MLQYLVILLDDTSVAYCHADNPLTERKLMPLDMLRKAIVWGMKENLMIHFVLPNYDLPQEYTELMETIDNIKIGKDIVVYNGVPSSPIASNIVLRLSLSELIAKQYEIALLIPQVARLTTCITDIDSFKDAQIKEYKNALSFFNKVLYSQYESGKRPQLNILTDRLNLDKMNNCGAGVSNLTLAPNGKFYLCPAFYYDEQMGISNRMNHHNPTSDRSVGDLDTGLHIPNQQLLKLDHAPLCRTCDAYHCHRCIWLNQRLTWDNNTPSHQQCVLANVERNASRELLQQLKTLGLLTTKKIKRITYLDPFEVREQI